MEQRRNLVHLRMRLKAQISGYAPLTIRVAQQDSYYSGLDY
jgi:hypothetical protein